MGNVLEESLYKRQPKQFERISDFSKEFSGVYCGNIILGASIFGIVENYARKRELSLEILRYPFKDTELWAFTFVKKGTIFLCVNSELSMCKQIFAAAHELYHIQEDLEANAFAGLLLMPDGMMREQVSLYGINGENIGVDEVLILMELFSIPYKAVVLRLHEGHIITQTKANELIKYDTDYVSQRIEVTGKGKQWQMNSIGIEYFGSLLNNLEFNSENELITESREVEDRKFLEKIKADFCNEG
jgi:Zn-dependent peptidase ImmA (M78 family)